MKRLVLPALLLALPPAAQADEITDTLQSAIEAYEAGDIQYALEELSFAQQQMQALRAEGLVSFLPAAPDGWTREDDTEMSAGLAMIGGGLGAEATYSGDGKEITLTLMADNPMVGAMAAMFANPMVLASSGKIYRVGRQKFLDQDGELVGLIDNRILIQASGGTPEEMIALLELIDYPALAKFGR